MAEFAIEVNDTEILRDRRDYYSNFFHCWKYMEEQMSSFFGIELKWTNLSLEAKAILDFVVP